MGKGQGKGGNMACCESMAAFQLWITNFLLVCGALMMIIFGIILMSKYVTAFSVFVMIIGVSLAMVATMGFCSAQTDANTRIYFYLILLGVAFLTQLVMATYFTIDPDVVEDNSGCATYDNSTTVVSCSPYNATTWCDYATCTSSNNTCCCACDQDCKDCNNSVQSVSDFMDDYKDAVTWSLWIVAVVELVAFLAAYCKMSYADERETATELDEDAPELNNSQLKDKYGDKSVTF
jgi:hypothetical protein